MKLFSFCGAKLCFADFSRHIDVRNLNVRGVYGSKNYWTARRILLSAMVYLIIAKGSYWNNSFTVRTITLVAVSCEFLLYTLFYATYRLAEI